MGGSVGPGELALLGEGALGVRDLVLIGVFLLADGYLIRVHELTGLIIWINADRAGMSEAKLARIVGTYILLISAVTFLCAGLIATGVSATAVEPLYYGLAIAIVLVQTLHVWLG